MGYLLEPDQLSLILDQVTRFFLFSSLCFFRPFQNFNFAFINTLQEKQDFATAKSPRYRGKAVAKLVDTGG
jgi:hypothetical protein